MKTRTIRNLALALLLSLVIYIGVSCTVYRFRNPGLTETQLFLELDRALLWR